MNRWQFLKNMGLSGAAIFALTCTGASLGSCTNEDDPPPTPTGVDFTLDLSAPENAPLSAIGGFIIKNKVVVATVSAGSYVAVTQICSHEGNPGITYKASAMEFVCSVHGARFNKEGQGINPNGKNNLKVYKTNLTGTKLRVTE